MTTTTDLETGNVLAVARRAHYEVMSGEALILSQAVEWARLHEVTEDSFEVATWGDTPVTLAGEGAPLVSEYCLAEFAAAVGMKTEAGRYFIAHALELAHRLPRLFARVMVGAVPVWRARRIAEKTLVLSAEAADFVDIEIAPAADKIGPIVTERLVDEAISRFMPDLAEALAEKAAETRRVVIDHRQPSFTGVSTIYGELDRADALELDAALARGAERLKELGSEDSLDVRRSRALGQLARGELSADSSRRDLTLYVHLNPDDPHATLENAGNQLLAVDQIKAWCGTATTVIVKPVLDLAEEISSVGYQPSARLVEQVVLRDRTCIFPRCERPARRCDRDHGIPYDDGGTTCSCNLAPLCRHHHRLKTHAGWSYTTIEPGTYLWLSPHGFSYLRDGTGTRELTPRPVEPPGRRR